MRPRTETQLIPLIDTAISSFKWTVDPHFHVQSLFPEQVAELMRVAKSLANTKFAISSPEKIPLGFWQIIKVPGKSCGMLRRHSDAKALACAIVRTTAEFCFWRNLALQGCNQTALEELIDERFFAIPTKTLTPFGSVHHDRDRVTYKRNVWFGRRDLMIPSLVGSEIFAAVRDLFQIEDR